VLSVISNNSFAQGGGGINYQAVVRDANGNVKPGQTGTVTFKILIGSANGTEIYEESHLVSTTNIGLFNVKIGQGSPTSSSGLGFIEIDWSAGEHFLNVSVDFFGLEDLGTIQLVSVPYAFYAESSGDTVIAGTGIQVLGKDTIINTGDLSNVNELISNITLLNDSLLIIEEGEFTADTVDISSLRSSTQSFTLNGTLDSLVLSGGGGAVAIVDLGINNTDNQNLTLDEDSIKIEGGTGVDLSKYADTNELTLLRNNAALNATMGVDTIIQLNDSALQITNLDGTIDTLNIRGNSGDNDLSNELIDSVRFASDFFLRFYEGGVLRDSLDLSNLNVTHTIDTVTFNNTTRDLTITENGVAYVTSIPLSVVADTTISSGSLVGNDIALVNNVGDTIKIDVSTINTAVAANATGILANKTDLRNARDSVQFLSDSLMSHVALDDDTSSTNEKIDAVVFNNTTRDLTITENGVAYVTSIPLSVVVADTTISSGSLVGSDIALVNNFGDTIKIDVSTVDTAITNNELNIVRHELDLRMIRDSVQFLSDSLLNHVALDNDISATNELQTLSINTVGDQLTISSGNTLNIGRLRDSANADIQDTAVILRSLINFKSRDNLGNHIATRNIELGTNYLSGDGDNEGIYINTAGNIGIGTTTPSVKLHIRATDNSGDIKLEDTYPFIYLNTTNGSNAGFQFHNAGQNRFEMYYSASSDNFLINHLSSFGTDLTITSAGNVGIGVSAPTERLEVAGKTKTTTLQVTDGAGANKVMISDANGNASWGSSVTPSNVTRSIAIAPGMFSNTAMYNSTHKTLGGWLLPVIEMADNTTCQIAMSLPLPSDWVAGTAIKIKLLYSSSTNSGNIFFSFGSLKLVENVSTITGTSSSDVSLNVSSTAHGLKEYSHSISMNVTTKVLHFTLRRKGTSGADTNSGLMYIHGVNIEYTAN